MSDPFRSIEDYELFIYSLTAQFPGILKSTLVLARRGATLARVSGELPFEAGYRVVVRERLSFERLPLVMDGYGYEIWRDEEKLCWYDSQPHPNEPALQSTHPHHKHVPPNIKHNRIPAENMSFEQPNLPALIAEVQALIEKRG